MRSAGRTGAVSTTTDCWPAGWSASRRKCSGKKLPKKCFFFLLHHFLFLKCSGKYQIIIWFPSRESKELSEFTQMHPAPMSSSMMTPSLMTPNLMVTGGAALAGAGRWPPDPSTLTSHPWMPRPGAPPVWLSSSPYSMWPYM